MKSLSAVLVLAVMAAATDIQGSLSGYLPAGNYTVIDDIYVPSGHTLTLAPGVTFNFEEGVFEEYEFDVYGTLNAIGSPSQHIVFQPAPGVGEFNYIRIASGSTVMQYCDIVGAGSVALSSDGGLLIDNCSPVIENTSVTSGKWHGVRISGGSACPQFFHCEFSGNMNDGVNADDGAGMTLVNCIVSSNGEDGICLSSGANTIVGTVVHNSAEDGIDCNGLTDHHALIVNCTVGQQGSEALSDCSLFDMINCAVVDGETALGQGSSHTLVIEDASFFSFQDPSSGNYRLSADSPLLENGTRFGSAASVLPISDPDGNPRINGIVDVGAFESTLPPSTGEEGTYFSAALLQPRMTRPVIRKPGETIEIDVARLGSFSPADAGVILLSPDGNVYPLTVTGLSHSDMVPGSIIEEVLYYCPGIERVQHITAAIPPGTPEDFYGIEVDLSGRTYHGTNSVKVVGEYPSEWGFIHITDIHVGYDQEEFTANERLMAAAEEVNILNPEFVVITGDICENQNIGNDYVDSLLHTVSMFRVPVLIIPGNHDHYNHGAGYYAHGWMRFFQQVTRVMNTEFKFGESRFYGINSQHDLGLTQLYRCWGPSDAALDWLEAALSSGTPSGPLFLGTHGPNFDYFSWNVNNTSRVVDILNGYGFSLALAGHTHRFETFLNQGSNYLGRNDFSHDDDWGRDVAFPGFPLHVQTSSLGKEEHLPYPGTEDLSSMIENRLELETLHHTIANDSQRGLFGDSIGWRWVQISGVEVEFFTVDNDGDGYRNTEDCWLLGEIQHTVEYLPGGSILSTVSNSHFENWYDIRHHIPAVPGTNYQVEGGTLLKQLPDGTVIAAVPVLSSQSISQVTLTPTSGAGSSESQGFSVTRLFTPGPNPVRGTANIEYSVATEGTHVRLEVFDLSGRSIALLRDEEEPAGIHSVSWNASQVPAGLYFCRMIAGDYVNTEELMVVR